MLEIISDRFLLIIELNLTADNFLEVSTIDLTSLFKLEIFIKSNTSL